MNWSKLMSLKIPSNRFLNSIELGCLMLKPALFLTNDDGVDATGLKLLIIALNHGLKKRIFEIYSF